VDHFSSRPQYGLLLPATLNRRSIIDVQQSMILHCWQWHVDTQRTQNALQRFLSQQWLREYEEILRYKYIVFTVMVYVNMAAHSKAGRLTKHTVVTYRYTVVVAV